MQTRKLKYDPEFMSYLDDEGDLFCCVSFVQKVLGFVAPDIIAVTISLTPFKGSREARYWEYWRMASTIGERFTIYAKAHRFIMDLIGKDDNRAATPRIYWKIESC